MITRMFAALLALITLMAAAPQVEMPLKGTGGRVLFSGGAEVMGIHVLVADGSRRLAEQSRLKFGG